MKNSLLIGGLALSLGMSAVPASANEAALTERVDHLDEHAIETTSEWKDGKLADRGGRRFVETMLAAHNGLRQSLGLPDLTWDPGLAYDAGVYAAQIAQTRRFEHADQDGEDAQGENLWMGTKSAYGYDEMTGSWSDEARDFKRGRFPDVTTTDAWQDVGHYTQMIWGTTRSVGCAAASNASDDFLVCRYYPAGNVAGHDPFDQSTRATSLAKASAR